MTTKQPVRRVLSPRVGAAVSKVPGMILTTALGSLIEIPRHARADTIDFVDAMGVIAQLPAPVVDFVFGDHCSRLEELTDQSLKNLTDPANERHWRLLCWLENPAECSKYSSIFDGAGRLTANASEPSMCSFVPRNDADELQPNDFHGPVPKRSMRLTTLSANVRTAH